MRLNNSASFAILLCLLAEAAFALESEREALSVRFEESVRPFLKQYCVDCHNKDKNEGKLDLSAETSLETVAGNQRRWDLVLQRLQDLEMPPEDARKQPPASDRQAVIQWIQSWRSYEIQRSAGDPGPVLARRLSNAEYDNTIRDLTGVDIRPAREFPIDPANEAGFDNSGESLTMSPDLLKKHLAAAQYVADHVLFKPDDFLFAPHPVVTDTDRDKYCVQRIIDFYNRQPVDLADYFFAAYLFENRASFGRRDATISDFTQENPIGLLSPIRPISPKYLALIHEVLTGSEHHSGPLAELRERWRALPGPAHAKIADVRQKCEQIRDFVQQERKSLVPEVKNLPLRGVSSGSQPLVLWKNRQMAANRRRYVGPATTPENDAALQRFCEVFPDAFFVSERGRIFLKEREPDRGRLLSAGFHLMVGYFRDDEPLRELILDEEGQRELDTLWQEFQFITLAPIRQYKDFIFFERAEPPRFMGESKFDFARSEDKDAAAQEKMDRLATLYLEKVRENDGSQESIEAIEHYFSNMSQEIRWIERTRIAAIPGHLAKLQKFAERAYRRPLSDSERSELVEFYQAQRTSGLDHEDAIRDSIVSILLSPHFFYRVDPPKPGAGVQPLSPYALASRMSYFLWSSMPDEELLAHAASGELQKPETLIAQSKRMMQDDRIRGLATEFGGNFLDFRAFEQHNSVDRERFPEFTSELRTAMFEEPVRFFMHVVRQDSSVLDFLNAPYTFVNPVLAKHYGMPTTFKQDEWVKVDDADQFGRGGLLPMSVFLTKNSPGLRTSPVKRGYWVVRRLLGEHIPPPPPNVPELPQDEKQLGERTLREVLAKHREHKSCAGCHEHFDSIGLVFEGYGPIGERREKDLGGRPVDFQATFPNGSTGAGLSGLRDYLREHRQDEFLDNLCRKLLVYALGRNLQLSDETTLHNMRQKLQAEDYRWGSLVETIVTSPQFVNQRGLDYDKNPLNK